MRFQIEMHVIISDDFEIRWAISIQNDSTGVIHQSRKVKKFCFAGSNNEEYASPN